MTRQRMFLVALTAATAAIAVALWLRGADFYTLAPWDRMRHPDHEALRSSGSWGLTLGVAGTALVVLNLSFLLRKHLRSMRRFGTLRRWMEMHVASGLLAPLLILYHSTFDLRSSVAITATVALGVLALTGIVGRFIYALVPRAPSGAELEREALEGRLAEARAGLEGLIPADDALWDRLEALATPRLGVPRTRLACPLLLPYFLVGKLSLGIRLRAVARHLRSRAGGRGAEVARGLAEAVQARRQLQLFGVYRGLLRWWRSLHRIFAVLMVVMMVAHVAAETWLGYAGVGASS